jgi:hypothetical protein
MLGISREKVLVVACDSAGGVGPKKHDLVKVPGSLVGKYATRTVMLEVICAGATISALTVSMGVEYDPTGKQILAGCRACLAEIGSSANIVWSSEKNFKVSATGVGVSAVGFARRHSVKIGRSRHGDLVAMVGRPSVGRAVLEAEGMRLIPSIRTAVGLMKSSFVHEVIPVGSTGLLHEAEVLARDSGLRFESAVPEAELRVSAGPSTALLVSIPPRALARLVRRLPLPLNVIGSLSGSG